VDGVEWDAIDFVRIEGGLERPPKIKRNKLGDLAGQGRVSTMHFAAGETMIQSCMARSRPKQVEPSTN
jgi:hypothetical protein